MEDLKHVLIIVGIFIGCLIIVLPPTVLLIEFEELWYRYFKENWISLIKHIVVYIVILVLTKPVVMLLIDIFIYSS